MRRIDTKMFEITEGKLQNDTYKREKPCKFIRPAEPTGE